MQFISALELRGFREATEMGEPRFEGNWYTFFDTVGRAHAAKSEEIGAQLVLPNMIGPFRLVFMKNSWSGIIEIHQNDNVQRVDLFSEYHKLFEIDVKINNSEARSVSVRILDQKNPSSNGQELWLHGIWAFHPQNWIRPVNRITDTLDVVNAQFGTFSTIRNDIGISHSIREFGAWGDDQVDLFKRIIIKGTNVLDIGANIGHHTVVLSRLVGPAGAVHAFEPQPFVYRVLQANLALNKCNNTHAHMCALGSVSGSAIMEPMSYEQDAWNVGGLGISSINDDTLHGTVVALRRLDQFKELENIDFIKCDAQGFDFEVMRGGFAIIERDLPIILFEVAPLTMLGGTGSYISLYKMLEKMGYLLLDPLSPDPSKPVRMWSGGPEEWDILAVQPHHLVRLGI